MLTKRIGWWIAGITLAVAAIAGAAVTVSAQRPGGGPPDGGFGPRMGGLMGDLLGPLGGPGLGMMAIALDLTDAQRDQIRAIGEQHRGEFRAVLDRSRPIRDALEQAMSANPLDEAAIRSRVNELSTIYADAAVLGARVRAEMVAVLTPAQVQKMAEIRQKTQERFQNRRERRPPQD